MSLVGEDQRLEVDFTYDWVSGISGFLVPILSVLLALAAGAVIVKVSGGDPGSAYQQLWLGSFGSLYNVSETLVSAIPLMLAGLAVAFAFRAGLFNIGAEGQIYIGAILSAFVGFKLNWPGYLLIPLALLSGAVGGAIWAGIAGVLKAWRGAHEVITTIMLNYIAVALIDYLLLPSSSGKAGPLSSPAFFGVPTTPPMHANLPVVLPSSWVANGRLHAGLFVALGGAVVFWFVLWHTSLGYKLRAVGLNPKAASFGGINVGWNIALAMFIAGAFAGLDGMVSVYGIAPYQLTDSFSPGYGFDAIAVALLGRNTAVGVILAAILFGAFAHGGALMQANAGTSVHLVEILQGLIIFFIGADAVLRYLARRGLINLPMFQQRGPGQEQAAA